MHLPKFFNEMFSHLQPKRFLKKDPRKKLPDGHKIFRKINMIEFRCVVTVSTPAVWLAREKIKRLTPRPCINVEYSHGVVYIEETTTVFH